MALIIDPDNLADSAIDDASQEVYIDTAAKRIKLNIVGLLSTDGVTLKCLYSFLKEQWRLDPFTKNLAAFEFPMVPITDESFEFQGGWDLFNDAARYLIRTAGWTVRDTSGNAIAKWAGIIGLGSIEANDQLYFYQGVGTGTNVQLLGQVNQAVQILDDPNGDGSYVDGFDYRTTFSLFAREYAQLYGKASLSQIGVTTMDSIAYRFPISTATDLKVSTIDATVGGTNDPYQHINIKYFATPFSRDVDSTTDRNFGIVIDVGTHSGVDGAGTGGTSTLTTAAGGIVGANYVGGTITIHEGVNAGTYPISGTPGAGSVVFTGMTWTGGQTGVSFTLQRATPIAATAEQIYEKVQWSLRQSTDIDNTTGSVIGKTADELLTFVGSDLKCGLSIPTNPAGGGSGVIIEGFSASDTNRIAFYDNLGTPRTYPYVAALTINFGDNLKNDASAKYWVYFTTLPGAGNDFGESGALIVDDNAGADMAGNVGGATSIVKSFNYDGNIQGGRTPSTPAAITVVGIGLSTGQYVKATSTIAQSTSNSVSLVAPLERNYANP
jgi:hypothetical protein